MRKKDCIARATGNWQASVIIHYIGYNSWKYESDTEGRAAQLLAPQTITNTGEP